MIKFKFKNLRCVIFRKRHVHGCDEFTLIVAAIFKNRNNRKETKTISNKIFRSFRFYLMSISVFLFSVVIFMNWPLLIITGKKSSSNFIFQFHSRARNHFKIVKNRFGFINRRKSKKLDDLFSMNEFSFVTKKKIYSVFEKWAKRPNDLNCALASKIPIDRRQDPSKLRIVSYNAEWLFLYGGEGSIKCPGENCPWADKSAAHHHLLRTAQLLVKLDADIIHLNEIENCRVLRVLMDLLPSNHGYRAYLVPGTDSMTGQNVGLLTRIDPSSNLKRTEERKAYPILGSTCGTNPYYYSNIFGSKRDRTMGLSKHYLTHFSIPLSDNGILKIVWAGAHLIAHPDNSDRCFRREAQASVLAEFIAKESKNSEVEVIVTGDLNDHDGDVLGANNISPLSSVLKILKIPKRLNSAASFVSDPLRRYTSWHDINGNCVDDGANEHSLIDHILISPGLAKLVVSVWMDHNRTTSCIERLSDHWPLIIDLKT